MSWPSSVSTLLRWKPYRCRKTEEEELYEGNINAYYKIRGLAAANQTNIRGTNVITFGVRNPFGDAGHDTRWRQVRELSWDVQRYGSAPQAIQFPARGALHGGDGWVRQLCSAGRSLVVVMATLMAEVLGGWPASSQVSLASTQAETRKPRP